MTGAEAWAIGATISFVLALQALRDSDEDYHRAREEYEKELGRLRAQLSEAAAHFELRLNEYKLTHRRRLIAVVKAARVNREAARQKTGQGP